MADLWIDVLLALFVTLATVAADWVANRIITSTRRMAAIKRAIEKTISDQAKLDEVKQEVSRFYTTQSTNLTWGSDLASIAFTIDLAILGVWISNPSWFPFFSKWNSPSTDRALPIWLIIIFAHFMLWLVSIALKNTHTDYIESLPAPSIIKFVKKGWFKQNVFLLSSNAIGFLSLLSGFIVITNAI